MSSLLESFFSSCMPDIHHSNRLLQKIPTTKLWQWETLMHSGKPTAKKSQVKTNSSPLNSEIYVKVSGNLIQMKELQWMGYYLTHGLMEKFQVNQKFMKNSNKEIEKTSKQKTKKEKREEIKKLGVEIVHIEKEMENSKLILQPSQWRNLLRLMITVQSFFPTTSLMILKQKS